MVVNYHRLAERLVEVADDVDALVEYLWDKELDDFKELYGYRDLENEQEARDPFVSDEQRSQDDAELENHIFHSIVKVSNALHDFGDTPEGCIRSGPISPQKPSGGERHPTSLLHASDPEEGP